MISMSGITGAATRSLEFLKNIATPELPEVEECNDHEVESVPYTEIAVTRTTVSPEDIEKIREFVHLKLVSEQRLKEGEVVNLNLQVYLSSFKGEKPNKEALIESLIASLKLEFQFERLSVAIRHQLVGDVQLEFYQLTVQHPVRQTLNVRPISSQSFQEFFMRSSTTPEEAFLNQLLESIAEELDLAGCVNPEEACKQSLKIKLSSTTVVPIEYQTALVQRMSLTDVSGAFFKPIHSIDTGDGVVQTFEFGINDKASK